MLPLGFNRSELQHYQLNMPHYSLLDHWIIEAASKQLYQVIVFFASDDEIADLRKRGFTFEATHHTGGLMRYKISW